MPAVSKVATQKSSAGTKTPAKRTSTNTRARTRGQRTTSKILEVPDSDDEDEEVITSRSTSKGAFEGVFIPKSDMASSTERGRPSESTAPSSIADSMDS